MAAIFNVQMSFSFLSMIKVITTLVAMGRQKSRRRESTRWRGREYGLPITMPPRRFVAHRGQG
jgi:hypothetical protein